MESEKFSKKSIKISLVINIIIFLLAVMSCIMLFFGFRFMKGHDVAMEPVGFKMFCFFTVQSNIFAGIASLLFALQEIKLLKGKISEISKKMYIIKLMATTAVGLTFLVVFAYLGPIAEYGLASMLMNSNLFLHLIIPVVSIVNFVIFERTNKIKFKDTLYGIIPTALYGVYYITNILVHMENGKVSPLYDWYFFVQAGVWTAVIVVPLMLGITYLISLVIWRLNKISE